MSFQIVTVERRYRERSGAATLDVDWDGVERWLLTKSDSLRIVSVSGRALDGKSAEIARHLASLRARRVPALQLDLVRAELDVADLRQRLAGFRPGSSRGIVFLDGAGLNSGPARRLRLVRQVHAELSNAFPGASYALFHRPDEAGAFDERSGGGHAIRRFELEPLDEPSLRAVFETNGVDGSPTLSAELAGAGSRAGDTPFIAGFFSREGRLPSSAEVFEEMLQASYAACAPMRAGRVRRGLSRLAVASLFGRAPMISSHDTTDSEYVNAVQVLRWGSEKVRALLRSPAFAIQTSQLSELRPRLRDYLAAEWVADRLERGDRGKVIRDLLSTSEGVLKPDVIECVGWVLRRDPEIQGIAIATDPALVSLSSHANALPLPVRRQAFRRLIARANRGEVTLPQVASLSPTALSELTPELIELARSAEDELLRAFALEALGVCRASEAARVCLSIGARPAEPARVRKVAVRVLAELASEDEIEALWDTLVSDKATPLELLNEAARSFSPNPIRPVAVVTALSEREQGEGTREAMCALAAEVRPRDVLRTVRWLARTDGPHRLEVLGAAMSRALVFAKVVRRGEVLLAEALSLLSRRASELSDVMRVELEERSRLYPKLRRRAFAHLVESAESDFEARVAARVSTRLLCVGSADLEWLNADSRGRDRLALAARDAISGAEERTQNLEMMDLSRRVANAGFSVPLRFAITTERLPLDESQPWLRRYLNDLPEPLAMADFEICAWIWSEVSARGGDATAVLGEGLAESFSDALRTSWRAFCPNLIAPRDEVFGRLVEAGVEGITLTVRRDGVAGFDEGLAIVAAHYAFAASVTPDFLVDLSELYPGAIRRVISRWLSEAGAEQERQFFEQLCVATPKVREIGVDLLVDLLAQDGAIDDVAFAMVSRLLYASERRDVSSLAPRLTWAAAMGTSVNALATNLALWLHLSAGSAWGFYRSYRAAGGKPIASALAMQLDLLTQDRREGGGSEESSLSSEIEALTGLLAELREAGALSPAALRTERRIISWLGEQPDPEAGLSLAAACRASRDALDLEHLIISIRAQRQSALRLAPSGFDEADVLRWEDDDGGGPADTRQLSDSVVRAIYDLGRHLRSARPWWRQSPDDVDMVARWLAWEIEARAATSLTIERSESVLTVRSGSAEVRVGVGFADVPLRKMVTSLIALSPGVWQLDVVVAVRFQQSHWRIEGEQVSVEELPAALATSLRVRGVPETVRVLTLDAEPERR